MKTLLILLIASPLFAVDISGGVTDYSPSLEHVRNNYELTVNPSGWYAKLRVEKDWYITSLTYTSCSTEGELNMNIHALEVSYIAEVPLTVKPYLGVGATGFYMRREFNTRYNDTVQNDFPYGVHALVGMRTKVGWLGTDAGYVWTWSRTSTLGGMEYDLGCNRWYAGITLGD